MEGTSPFDLAHSLHAQVIRLLRDFDIQDLPVSEREVLTDIKRQAADVRLDIRDYGMAETKAEQDQAAHEVRVRLKQLEDAVVKAGGMGLLSPVDVAHLSAIIQQLMSDL